MGVVVGVGRENRLLELREKGAEGVWKVACSRADCGISAGAFRECSEGGKEEGKKVVDETLGWAGEEGPVWGSVDTPLRGESKGDRGGNRFVD